MFRKLRVTLYGFGYNCHFVWFYSVSMTRCQIYYYRILEITQKLDFVTQMCLSDISIWLVPSDLNTLASFWKLKFRFFHLKKDGLRWNMHHRTLIQWKFMKFIDLSLTLSSYSRFVRFESTEHLKTTSSLWIWRNCWVHLPLFCFFTSVEKTVKILIHVIPLHNIRVYIWYFLTPQKSKIVCKHLCRTILILPMGKNDRSKICTSECSKFARKFHFSGQ